MAGELGPLRSLFTKSVVARTDLPRGRCSPKPTWR